MRDDVGKRASRGHVAGLRWSRMDTPDCLSDLHADANGDAEEDEEGTNPNG